MSDQFGFWAGWVLKALYDAHPTDVDLSPDIKISRNFWPTIESDEYFSNLYLYLYNSGYITAGNKDELLYGIGLRLTEKGYKTVATLPSYLHEKMPFTEIGLKVLTGVAIPGASLMKALKGG